ncbi:MAG TPA: hypothetical protein PK668_12200 [Myxococcota bacterium]|nr:hypothetical protein [Myxococcota bacterium]HRY93770.1 hypothetical protein [Myxococcota bacterium]HSA21434.1 hypothetical protein [Myxococcota bacterium]
MGKKKDKKGGKKKDNKKKDGKKKADKEKAGKRKAGKRKADKRRSGQDKGVARADLHPEARAAAERMAAAQQASRDRLRQAFEAAWLGMEPTFQSRRTVELWKALAAREGGEDAYFLHRDMLGPQRAVAQGILDKYAQKLSERDPCCLFERAKLETDQDQWGTRRLAVEFGWADRQAEPFKVRVTIDPETVEFSIKPVPLAWFEEELFVRFLDEFVWEVPRKAGLSASIAHGGAQFSLSAKTFMRGSLLADDVAARLDHPELCTWMMDWPNPDDRAYRATRPRFQAYQRVLAAYRAGGFHPRANGPLRVEHALLDRGFGPCPAPPAGLMDPARGPVGDAREVFQTNFAFGRALRLQAQSVHPGYWQAAHPHETGYRPDQIMRYSEGNLNRLQIAGQCHVKSDKVLDPDRVPELDAPLELAHLYDEASYEDRGQMGRTSARDFTEALLLDTNFARHLSAHPGVEARASLLQDQLLGDAERTLLRHKGPRALERLRAEARAESLAMSQGRVKSDFIEPETLFWAAWEALPAPERAAIAREAVTGFVERVEAAAACDPRPASRGRDPMEWHRHRVHPVLWRALEARKADLAAGDPVRRELERFLGDPARYLARRPVFSQAGIPPPWRE